MRWYAATRHSFASRYVTAGGSLMKLAQILGHSSVEVSLRYAHLRPGNHGGGAPSSTSSAPRPRWFPWSAGRDDRHACYAGITRGLDQSPAPRLSSRDPGPGGVAERLKAAVLKFSRHRQTRLTAGNVRQAFERKAGSRGGRVRVSWRLVATTRFRIAYAPEGCRTPSGADSTLAELKSGQWLEVAARASPPA